MKKCLALLIYFTLNSIANAFPLPTIPTPTDANSSKGIIFNKSAAEASITYGICEFTPADMQHRAVVCPPPFSSETIATGQHLTILIPKDLLDAEGKLITHYTAMITEITSNGVTWQPSDRSCGMDISKHLNSIMFSLKQSANSCVSGTVVCKDEQCQLFDFQPYVTNP